MSYSLSSGTLSSRSLGGCLRYPASSCGSFYPGNVCPGSAYPGNVAYAQGPCQQGSPPYGCQETCWEPAGCPAPGYGYSYGRRPSSLCRPLQATCPSSSGCGGAGLGPFGYGGSRAQSVGCGSGYCHPTYFSSSRTYQSPSFQPACSSGWYGQGQTY